MSIAAADFAVLAVVETTVEAAVVLVDMAADLASPVDRQDTVVAVDNYCVIAAVLETVDAPVVVIVALDAELVLDEL